MNLKEYLVGVGMTINQFSKVIGFHAPYISAIISGKRRPSKEFLECVEKCTQNEVTMLDVLMPKKLNLKPPIKIERQKKKKKEKANE